MKGLNYYSSEIGIGNDIRKSGFILSYKENPVSLYDLSYHLKVDEQIIKQTLKACGIIEYKHERYQRGCMYFSKAEQAEAAIVALTLLSR